MSDGIQFYLYFAGKNKDHCRIVEESTCFEWAIDKLLGELLNEYPEYVYWAFDYSDNFIKRWLGKRNVRKFYKEIGGR